LIGNDYVNRASVSQVDQPIALKVVNESFGVIWRQAD
jgi:hypothetical protein